MAWRKLSKRSTKSRKYSRKPARRFKKSFKRSVHKHIKPNIATVKETLNKGEILLADPVMGQSIMESIKLSDFARASVVARSYRFYRIKRVTYQYKFQYNAYQAGGLSQATVPYLYWRMCRDANMQGGGSSTADTVTELLQQGAKAVKGMGIKKVSYVPNIAMATPMLDADGAVDVNSVGNSANVNNSYVTIKKSPWLSTATLTRSTTAGQVLPGDGTSALHFGHMWIAVCDVGIAGERGPDYDVTIEVEFKQPLSLNNPA